MSYIFFDKSQLINLEYSLDREILRTNRAGAYASTTIVGCNTRKYHGLLVCPIENFDGEKHVLLSSVDETIVQKEYEFNLGIHKYEGDIYYPRGHKYIREFEAIQIAKMTYRVGTDIFTKETLLVEKENQILIRYTFLEGNAPVTFRLKPLLAFREMHSLSKVNMYVNSKVRKAKNGIASKMYNGYPYLYMQFSKETEFIAMPDWNHNIEYIREQERGYDYKEDLFMPGYFECKLRKGEAIVFSASTKEASPQTLKRKFEQQVSSRLPRDNYENCLLNAAEQFVVRKERKTEIIAGYPWFGSWGRDTFIALPGLTLAKGDIQTCRQVLDTQLSKMKGGLFPNMDNDQNPDFNSVDAPLWFFWTVQQLANHINDEDEIWKKYGKAMKVILNSYRKGLDFNIKMHDNGLVYAGETGKALTWMDAVVNGKAVTPRIGYAVEVNALWYNAVNFALDLAGKMGDTAFVKSWKAIPERIKTSFINTFWSKEKRHLADLVDGDMKDFSVRANQIFATSLPFTMLGPEMMKDVVDIVHRELLTPKGLRTLSPKNTFYKGMYIGSQEERDHAYHQGTVWPWLLEHFCEGYIKVYKESGIPLVSRIFNGFEEDMLSHGVGSVSEIYDGNPPHKPQGAISQAWSVAALLRIGKMLEKYIN
jgi:predicted glycogen debranching enzyme